MKYKYLILYCNKITKVELMHQTPKFYFVRFLDRDCTYKERKGVDCFDTWHEAWYALVKRRAGWLNSTKELLEQEQKCFNDVVNMEAPE